MHCSDFYLVLKFFTIQLVILHVNSNGIFWHVTDFHMDQNYSRTARPEQMCHGKEFPGTDSGIFGNYRCDSPMYLINVTIRDMKIIQPHPDFIIWTGDNLPHTRDPDPGWDTIYEGISNITSMLQENFPGILIIPSIGNHDVYPPNKMPVDDSQLVYDAYLKRGGWQSLLSEESRRTFLKGGYFSEIAKTGLRVISLNTILWYTPNTLTAKLTDPSDQFQWLENVLKNSTKSTEKVYIIGHVPPGYYNRAAVGKKSKPTFHKQYHVTYLDILYKYSNIIIGQFYGHLHMDYFQLFEFDTGIFQSSSLLASSVTPWFYPDKDGVVVPVNPSIRLLQFYNSNFSLIDYDQYFLNLTKANSVPVENVDPTKTVYEHLYGFRDTYKVPDLSTQSLVKVYENLKSNQTTFEVFIHYLTAGKDIATCDKGCIVDQLCAIAGTSIEDYDKCMSNAENVPKGSPAALTVIYVMIPIVVLICIGFILYRRWAHRRQIEYQAYLY